MIDKPRIALLVVLAAAAALAAPALKRRIGPAQLEPRPAAPPARPPAPAAAPAAPAPVAGAERTVSLRKGSRDLSKPSGKLLVVHFWATWCASCEDELPGLLAWAREVKGAGDVDVLAVSVDESWEKVDGWLEKRGVADLPLALDPKGATARAFGTVKFPETWFLAPDGAVLAHWVGPRDWTTRATLAELATLRKEAAPGT